jgi:hypothetical protein
MPYRHNFQQTARVRFILTPESHSSVLDHRNLENAAHPSITSAHLKRYRLNQSAARLLTETLLFHTLRIPLHTGRG